jgi:hypothetical protein
MWKSLLALCLVLYQRQCLALSTPAIPAARQAVPTALPSLEWVARAERHASELETLLYPPGTTVKSRSHSVKMHPIYNFLHTYYRYSTKEITAYSPGLGVVLERESLEEGAVLCKRHLQEKYVQHTEQGYVYDLMDMRSKPSSRYGWISVTKVRDILQATANRQPFYGCYGLHEWAMLYSGGGGGVGGDASELKRQQERHQQLPLRVSQAVIDEVVTAPGQLRCTHYDAFRFFQPEAQPLNLHTPLTRPTQVAYEQPGCVHANMDLFKYAFTLYPFLPSDLLLDTLKLALRCRKVDMRASPYDVSHYLPDSEPPICVETIEGRKVYMLEQEALAEAAAPVRARVLQCYNTYLSVYSANKV